MFAFMNTNVYDSYLYSKGSNFLYNGKILLPCVKIKHFGVRSFCTTSRPGISKMLIDENKNRNECAPLRMKVISPALLPVRYCCGN